MEYGTQVLELLTEINETSAINVKSRRVCSLIRRSRRRKVHCLSFGRCVIYVVSYVVVMWEFGAVETQRCEGRSLGDFTDVYG